MASPTRNYASKVGKVRSSSTYVTASDGQRIRVERMLLSPATVYQLSHGEPSPQLDEILQEIEIERLVLQNN